MTAHITTEDREAAEKFAYRFTVSFPREDEEIINAEIVKEISSHFLVGITHARSQPDSEFTKGFQYAVELLRSEECLRHEFELGWSHELSCKHLADYLETKFKDKR